MTTPLTPAERDELRERNEFSQPHDRAYALWSEIVALLDERDRLAAENEGRTVSCSQCEATLAELAALRTAAQAIIDAERAFTSYPNHGTDETFEEVLANRWRAVDLLTLLMMGKSEALGGDPQ